MNPSECQLARSIIAWSHVPSALSEGRPKDYEGTRTYYEMAGFQLNALLVSLKKDSQRKFPVTRCGGSGSFEQWARQNRSAFSWLGCNSARVVWETLGSIDEQLEALRLDLIPWSFASTLIADDVSSLDARDAPLAGVCNLGQIFLRLSTSAQEHLVLIEHDKIEEAVLGFYRPKNLSSLPRDSSASASDLGSFPS